MLRPYGAARVVMSWQGNRAAIELKVDRTKKARFALMSLKIFSVAAKHFELAVAGDEQRAAQPIRPGRQLCGESPQYLQAGTVVRTRHQQRILRRHRGDDVAVDLNLPARPDIVGKEQACFVVAAGLDEKNAVGAWTHFDLR